jgi:acetyl esterase/lipase
MALDPLFQRGIDLISQLDLPDSELLERFYLPPTNAVYPDVEAVDYQVAGSEFSIPVRVYKPWGEKVRPALFWMHGGGFIGGDLNVVEADVISRELASRLDAVIISSDYRLCNEKVRFPAPHIDIYEAFTWAVNNTDFQINPQQIFIGGGSAGACLAASLQLRLRDEKFPLAATLLIYPITHDQLPPQSKELLEKTKGIPRQLLFEESFIASHNAFLRDGLPAGVAPYYFFSGEAKDLTRLSPTLIINSEYDTLRASGEEYARQLRSAGNDLSEFLQEGAIHGQLAFYPQDSVSCEETLVLMTNYINRYLKAKE